MYRDDQANMVLQAESNLSRYYGSGDATNPAGGTVLVDTGALNEGVYDLNIMVSCSVAVNGSYIEIRQYNGADAVMWRWPMFMLAGTCIVFHLNNVATTGSDYFKLMMNAGITGIVSYAMLWRRRV